MTRKTHNGKMQGKKNWQRPLKLIEIGAENIVLWEGKARALQSRLFLSRSLIVFVDICTLPIISSRKTKIEQFYFLLFLSSI